MLRLRRGEDREDRESGQIMILFALVIVVVLAFAAIVIDLGVLRNDRQILVNAVDAGALAGGTLMPVDGSLPGAYTTVNNLVQTTVNANYPDLPSSAYNISYRCLIGTGAGNPGAFDSADIARFIPMDCNPSHALGGAPVLGDFIGAGATRSSICRPDLGDKCNVVVVDSNVTTPYTFARVVGVDSGNTGVVTSAACRGLCGELPAVFDVELVIDTSGSMTGNYSGSPSEPRIYWAELAANQLVTNLSNNGGIGPTGNRVGITTFRGNTGTDTAGVSYDGHDVSYPNAWASTAGTQLTSIINTLPAGGTTPTKEGMAAAQDDLGSHARNPVGGGVERVIILLSDGRPNPDLGPNCYPATIQSGNERPTQAEIDAYLASADVAYSIMIGDPSTSLACNTVAPPNLNANILDTGFMKMLATPDKPTANPPEKYFYNVLDASGLPNVFNSIASQILGTKAHLIQVYPTPVVTGVNPNSGTMQGGTSVTISGKYFTGTSSVTFGGAQATSVTVTSDSTITVTTPAGSLGQVDVIVTTSAGSSPISAADGFTYTSP